MVVRPSIGTRLRVLHVRHKRHKSPDSATFVVYVVQGETKLEVFMVDYLRLAQQALTKYRADHPAYPEPSPECQPPFPRCPHCASFALYPNKQGDYECMSCGLQQISEAAARRNPE
jgi:hypothetical protein